MGGLDGVPPGAGIVGVPRGDGFVAVEYERVDYIEPSLRNWSEWTRAAARRMRERGWVSTGTLVAAEQLIEIGTCGGNTIVVDASRSDEALTRWLDAGRAEFRFG